MKPRTLIASIVAMIAGELAMQTGGNSGKMKRAIKKNNAFRKLPPASRLGKNKMQKNWNVSAKNKPK